MAGLRNPRFEVHVVKCELFRNAGYQLLVSGRRMAHIFRPAPGRATQTQTRIPINPLDRFWKLPAARRQQIHARVDSSKTSSRASEESPRAPKRQSTLSSTSSQLALVATAVLWGTNPVCLRFLDLSGHPPSPATVTAAQSAVAAIWLRALDILSGVWWPHADASSTGAPNLRSEEDQEATHSRKHTNGADSPEPGWSLSKAWQRAQGSSQLAAIELGCWMFCANAATVIGFEQTSASRGAFLIRLTAVFTPFVALAAGQQSGPSVWVGSGIAFAGGLLISFGQQGVGDGLIAVNAGDLIMAGAALLWACQTVRLGQQVARHDIRKLAYQQMAVNALFCSVWWASEQLGAGHLPALGPVGAEWHDPWRWVALLWPAIGPWGLGTLFQLAGQQSVSPARTQIILASDPVWATLLSGILLGSSEQQLGKLGWAGAALILAASVASKE